MTEPTQTAEQTAQTTSAGEQTATQTAQPSVEELSKQLEAEKAQRAEAVRAMNEKMREAAERKSELESVKLMASTYQGQLAAMQTQADPVAEARKQIVALREAGDYNKADEIQAKVFDYERSESIRQVATVSLTNQLSALEMNPAISEDAKKIIREMAFNDPGNPERGLRADSLNELLATAVKPLGFKRLVDQAEERALGRKVKTGEWEKEYSLKQQESERKRQEEIKRQTSVTQPGGGVPAAPTTAEEKKKFDEDFTNKILNARRP